MYIDDATVHIMYIQKLRVQEEPPGNWNCVMRWYAGDEAHDCSHEFFLNHGVNPVKYCVFLVTNGSTCELALTLSFVEGNHIAVALELDLSSFSTSENFEKIDVDLLDQGGTFATAELHTACQKRWGVGVPDTYQGMKFIRPIIADPQAWFLLQHVAPEAAQREKRLSAQQSEEACAAEQASHSNPSISMQTPTDTAEDVGVVDDICVEDLTRTSQESLLVADTVRDGNDESTVGPERTNGAHEQLNQQMDDGWLTDEEDPQRRVEDRQAKEADRARSIDEVVQLVEEKDAWDVSEQQQHRAEEDVLWVEKNYLRRAKEDMRRMEEDSLRRPEEDKRAEENKRRVEEDLRRTEEENLRCARDDRQRAEENKRSVEEDSRWMEEENLECTKEDKRAEENKWRVEEDLQRMEEKNLQRANEDRQRAKENTRRMEENLRRMEVENLHCKQDGKQRAEQNEQQNKEDSLENAQEDKLRAEKEERQRAEEESKHMRAEQKKFLMKQERMKFERLQQEQRIEAAEEKRKIALVKEDLRGREVVGGVEKQRHNEADITECEKTKLALEAEIRAQLEKEIREQVEREVRDGLHCQENAVPSMEERMVASSTEVTASAMVPEQQASSLLMRPQLAFDPPQPLHANNHTATPIPWQSDGPTRILSSSIAAHLQGVEALSPRDLLLHPSTSSTSKPRQDADVHSPRLLDTLSQTQHTLHHARMQVQVEYNRLAAEKLRLEEETRRVEAARLALCAVEEPSSDAVWPQHLVLEGRGNIGWAGEESQRSMQRPPHSGWEELGGNESRARGGLVEDKPPEPPWYFENAWEELVMDAPETGRQTLQLSGKTPIPQNGLQTSQLTGKPPIPENSQHAHQFTGTPAIFPDAPTDGMLITRISPPKRQSQQRRQQVLTSNIVLEGGSELGDLDFGMDPEVASQHAVAPVVTDFHQRFQDLRRQSRERKSYESGLSVTDARGSVVPLRASQALDERSERALARLLSIRRQWTNGKPATSVVAAVVETLDHCLGQVKQADNSLLDNCIRYPQAHMADLRDLREKFASLLPSKSQHSGANLPLVGSVEGASLTVRHSGPKDSTPAVPGSRPTIQRNGSRSVSFSASRSHSQATLDRKTASRRTANSRLATSSRSSTACRVTIASDPLGVGRKTPSTRLSRESPETAHPSVDWVVDQIHDPLPIGTHERLVRHSPKKVSCFKFPGGHHVPPPISPDASPLMSPEPRISVASGRITCNDVSPQEQESSSDSAPRSVDDSDKYLRILRKLERSPLFKKGFARSSTSMVPQIPILSSANPRSKVASSYDPQYAEVERAIRMSAVGYRG